MSRDWLIIIIYDSKQLGRGVLEFDPETPMVLATPDRSRRFSQQHAHAFESPVVSRTRIGIAMTWDLG